MRTLVGPTIGYNVVRALCSGVTLSLLFAGAAAWSAMTGEAPPGTSSGELVGAIFGLILGPLIILPIGLLCAWAAKTFRGWFMSGNPVAGIVGLFVGGYFWVTLLAMMIGDPAVLLLKRMAPGLVPLDRPPLWNPHLLIFVQHDENAAMEEEAFTPQVQNAHSRRQAVSNADSQELRRPLAEAPSRAPPTAADWIETTSGIVDDRIRHALEAANSYLDEATALIHPPTAIGAAKADEIDRLVVLTRDQLADARAENETANEPGVNDYIELLDATAQQYAGMAQALGRHRLAEGARLIERAVERLEGLGRRHGQNQTPHLSLYLLSLIHLDLGDKGAALACIQRAIAADPDNQDYRQLRDEIEGQLTPAGTAKSSANGGAILVVALALCVAGGAAFYFWQSNRTVVQAQTVDPNRFEVLPYSAQEVVVARESELNIRALPFARPDIAVLRETTAGEVLDVMGLVNQPDGPWYQIRLADGQVGYVKASLAVAQSAYLAASLTEFSGLWRNVDSATRDLTRISVRQSDNAFFVHVFGSCSPTDCDWGETSLSVAAEDTAERRVATAFYDQGFAEVRLTMVSAPGSNVVEYTTFTHFKDGSGRRDYQSQGVLRRGSDDGRVTAPRQQGSTLAAAGEAPVLDIGGVWRGEYWRQGRRPVALEMTISVVGERFSGSASEPRLLGPLLLSVGGTAQVDRSLSFATRAAGGYVTQYTGTLSEDGVITGQWQRGDLSGEFRLQRVMAGK